MSSAIRVARIAAHSAVLGPGARAILWVHGCALRCPGCVAEEILSIGGGTELPVDEVAGRLLRSSSIEGVTFSGGEPFIQAEALCLLADRLRELRPQLTLMSYSGYPIERLRRGTVAQRALLDRLDLLIDGPYIQARHRPLRWRGSDNQRLHVLTDRYAGIDAEPDVPAGIEVHVGEDAVVEWTGVPPMREFRADLERAFAAQGLRTVSEEVVA